MDFSEKWGTSIDNAVDLALIDLRLTRDQVDVIVLEEPSKGFFGIGSKLAKVRVEKKKEQAVVEEKPVVKNEYRKVSEATEEKKVFNMERKAPREDRPRTSEASKPVAPAMKPKTKPTFERSKKEANFEGLRHEKPENLVAVAPDNKVLVFILELTEKMGLEVTVEAQENEDMIFVDIEGKDSGTIIGKRGQTLDAIQYLTSLVANKGDGKYLKVVVDAENYRQKRERTLEQLANRLAMKVIKSRKSVRLEPMNPYERKVIHATLQSNPEVTTRSEGEEPYRRVIIDLK